MATQMMQFGAATGTGAGDAGGQPDAGAARHRCLSPKCEEEAGQAAERDGAATAASDAPGGHLPRAGRLRHRGPAPRLAQQLDGINPAIAFPPPVTLAVRAGITVG